MRRKHSVQPIRPMGQIKIVPPRNDPKPPENKPESSQEKLCKLQEKKLTVSYSHVSQEKNMMTLEDIDSVIDTIVHDDWVWDCFCDSIYDDFVKWDDEGLEKL